MSEEELRSLGEMVHEQYKENAMRKSGLTSGGTKFLWDCEGTVGELEKELEEELGELDKLKDKGLEEEIREKGKPQKVQKLGKQLKQSRYQKEIAEKCEKLHIRKKRKNQLQQKLEKIKKEIPNLQKEIKQM